MLIKQVYEFRGVQERLSKKGTKNFVLNFEGENGEGTQIYTNDEKILQSLQKGQRYIVSFSINGFAFLNNVAPLK